MSSVSSDVSVKMYAMMVRCPSVSIDFCIVCLEMFHWLSEQTDECESLFYAVII